ncbi:hypothetical protein Tco_1361138 [Tanacetum coccineum]
MHSPNSPLNVRTLYKGAHEHTSGKSYGKFRNTSMDSAETSSARRRVSPRPNLEDLPSDNEDQKRDISEIARQISLKDEDEDMSRPNRRRQKDRHAFYAAHDIADFIRRIRKERNAF